MTNYRRTTAGLRFQATTFEFQAGQTIHLESETGTEKLSGGMKVAEKGSQKEIRAKEPGRIHGAEGWFASPGSAAKDCPVTAGHR
ncbi:hypothetical protein [Streptomyces anulatus]|uniref:hypothetical protein n=1 Tax=Streptomyces anulatus TaxID=1892 RepID=UPI003637FE54